MAYALLGAFSALSVAGFVVMLVVTAFYAIEMANFKRNNDLEEAARCEYGHGAHYGYAYVPSYGTYGGAYGSYGYASYGEDESAKDNRNLKFSFDAILAERLRLTLVFAYILGVVFAVVFFFSCGVALGLNLRDVSYDWLKCYVVEFESTVTLVTIALSCVVTIAGIFIFNRFNLMLTDEYYLKTSDVLRLLVGAFVGCLVFLCIGRSFTMLKIELLKGNALVPLVILVVTALEILMAVAIFITSLKCRKCMNCDLDEGSAIRRLNWVTFFLLLIFDIVPVALLVISTFYVWRGLI